MCMPEAAVDLDDLPPTRERNVRSSRDTLQLHAKPVTQPVEQFAHDYLGFGVRALDARHDRAALLRREAINHLPNMGMGRVESSFQIEARRFRASPLCARAKSNGLTVEPISSPANIVAEFLASLARPGNVAADAP